MNETKSGGTAYAGKLSLRSRLSYSMACFGRDINYTLATGFIMTYLTLAVGITDWQLAAIGVVMVFARIWDAVNDPIMGIIIDNTRSRFGKFKPYIITGALLNSVMTIILFSMRVPNEKLFVVILAVSYVLWDMTYTMNDISYWGMLPSLTVDPDERNRLTSLVRIFASLGAFLMTAMVPLLTAGRANTMYRTLAIIVGMIFVASQILVVIGVQEPKLSFTKPGKKQSFRDILKIIFKNDQLLVIGLVMVLLELAFAITVGFGVQFFYFDYGVYGGSEFTIFALTLGVTQILTLSLAPTLLKKLPRRTQFTIGTLLMAIGYITFTLVGTILPMSMAALVCVGVILFSGQAIVQLLVYVSIADTVEYGQWKLGTRNESVTYSLRPFLTKLSSAIQAAVFSAAMIISGLNYYANQISVIENDSALDAAAKIAAGNEVVSRIPDSAALVLRFFMLVLPLILTVIALIIFRTKYSMNEERYAQILADLDQRSREEEAVEIEA